MDRPDLFPSFAEDLFGLGWSLSPSSPTTSPTCLPGTRQPTDANFPSDDPADLRVLLKSPGKVLLKSASSHQWHQPPAPASSDVFWVSSVLGGSTDLYFDAVRARHSQQAPDQPANSAFAEFWFSCLRQPVEFRAACEAVRAAAAQKKTLLVLEFGSHPVCQQYLTKNFFEEGAYCVSFQARLPSSESSEKALLVLAKGMERVVSCQTCCRRTEEGAPPVAWDRLPARAQALLKEEQVFSAKVFPRGQGKTLPRTVEEAKMCERWASVLGGSIIVGVFDNFFELGGDSFAATALESLTGIPALTILQNPTVAGLCGETGSSSGNLALSGAGTNRPSEQLAGGFAISKAPPSGRDLPCRAEARMVIEQARNPESTALNLNYRFWYNCGGTTTGPSKQSLLENTKKLIEDCSVLRTRFPGGKVEVFVLDPGTQGMGAGEMQMIFTPTPQDKDLNFLNWSFDLEKGPLCRIFIAEPEENEDGFIITFSLHHSIADGKSIPLLAARLLQPKPEPSLDVRDYAFWEAENFNGSDELDSQLDAWGVVLGQYLDDADGLFDVPDVEPVKEGGEPRFHQSYLSMSPDEVSALKSWAAKNGVSPFIAAVSILTRVLENYSKARPYCLGVAYDLRPPGPLSDAVGMFVNTVLFPVSGGEDAVRSGGAAGPETRSHGGAVGGAAGELQRRWLGEILPLARVPYDEVVSALGVSCNVMMAFNTEFGIERYVGGGVSSGGGDIEDIVRELPIPASEFQKSDAQFDLAVSFLSGRGGVGRMGSDAGDSTREWLIQLESRSASQWVGLEDAFRRVIGTEIMGLGQAEIKGTLKPPHWWGRGEQDSVNFEQRVLDWGRGPSLDIPKNLLLHQLFEQAAGKFPDNIALICGTETLTYAELDRKATVLAAALAGVKTGELVGLLSTKSLNLLVGEIAILKAGAAFLPLDPNYPKDRVDFIFEDAGVRIVLTESQYEDKVPETSARKKAICMDKFDFGAASRPARRAPAASRPPVNPTSSRAYTIYTSGSTGKPKGVSISHHSAVNYVLGESHNVRSTDVVQLFFSYVYFQTLLLHAPHSTTHH